MVVPRRRLQSADAAEKSDTTELSPDQLKLEQHRRGLGIDRDDLDAALIEQPSLFERAADRYVEACGERDSKKLELEQFIASLEFKIRREAQAAETKITEGAVTAQVNVDEDVRRLQRQLQVLKTRAERWGVLKESFQQRSYMLKELVASNVARLYNLGLEKGSNYGGARDRVSERVRGEAGRLRHGDDSERRRRD